jgi:hypothetical protein
LALAIESLYGEVHVFPSGSHEEVERSRLVQAFEYAPAGDFCSGGATVAAAVRRPKGRLHHGHASDDRSGRNVVAKLIAGHN